MHLHLNEYTYNFIYNMNGCRVCVLMKILCSVSLNRTNMSRSWKMVDRGWKTFFLVELHSSVNILRMVLQKTSFSCNKYE